jgi:hypothetical protein
MSLPLDCAVAPYSIALRVPAGQHWCAGCAVSAQLIDELTHPTASYSQPAALLAMLLMDKCAFAEVSPDLRLEEQIAEPIIWYDSSAPANGWVGRMPLYPARWCDPVNRLMEAPRCCGEEE